MPRILNPNPKSKILNQEVKQRLAHDGFAKQNKHHQKMVTAISKEVDRVIATHKARDAAWYNEVGFPASTRFRV